MKREQEGGGPEPTPFLPLPRTRPRDSLWQHAVSMLALKSRRTLRARVALSSVGISYTYIRARTECRSQKAVVEGPQHDGGTARYGTVENCQGQGGGKHPLFRGGSLHGSAHPNSLHSLDPGGGGGSRWFLTPSRLPDVLSKIRHRGYRADGTRFTAAMETASKPRLSPPLSFSSLPVAVIVFSQSRRFGYESKA